MKKIILQVRVISILLLIFCFSFSTKSFSQVVTLTTTPTAAGNIAQGTSNNIFYIVKMDVATLPVTVNNIQFTLTGTHDDNDLAALNVYFNPTNASLTGASIVAYNIAANFAAPHVYSTSFNNSGPKTIAAGTSGYFIIGGNVDAAATGGNTVKINAAANPVIFGYTTAPTIINNQADLAGIQTIQATGLTLTSQTIAAANIAQGSTNNILYAVKMDVTNFPVIVNNIQFTLTGTHDNNDLAALNVYFNPTAPSLTGASIVAYNIAANFAAPHGYNNSFNNSGPITIPAGTSGYFIIGGNVDAAATSGNTVKINAAANPVIFGYTTAPTITNNQTDLAGIQTIQATGLTLTSQTIAAANIAQGSTNNILYAVKMEVTNFPVIVNNIQFTLTGTHDNNDLAALNVYFNPTAPSLTGASIVAYNIAANFAAPHVYSTSFNNSGPKTISAGTSGYFIIGGNVDAAATSGNTVKINAAANPVIFGYTTAPTITNNQADLAGIQTIQAAGLTLTSQTLAAANIVQGSTNNILYAVKMDVTNFPVIVNNIQFTLTGTHDNNDLSALNVYFNPTAPSLTGASIAAYNIAANFAAPHIYSSSFNNSGPITIAAGSSGYFIITYNLDAAATIGNTIIIDGATNPVIFSYTTSPPITNNQTNSAGPQTITSILPLTLLNFKGSLVNNQAIQLQWTTTGEINTKNFEVEWRNDASQFDKIAALPAAISSSQNELYSFTHSTPAEGNNYYRLRIVDQDGQFTYSPVVKISVGNTIAKVTAFPNPVADVLTLTIQAINNETMICNLFNGDGKLVTAKSFAVKKGINKFSWNLSQIAKGNYFITSNSSHFETIKIIRE